MISIDLFSVLDNLISIVPSLIKGFESLDYSCDGWDNIKVPCNIELAGYGNPQYVNKQYPWEGKENIVPGQIPSHFNPVGSYVKEIEINQGDQFNADKMNAVMTMTSSSSLR